MKSMDRSYTVTLLFLLLLGGATIVGGLSAEAHDPEECVCPEPPPCPELVCADGSTPVPVTSEAGDTDSHSPKDVSAPAPDQEAIEKALKLIEQAEAQMERQVPE